MKTLFLSVLLMTFSMMLSRGNEGHRLDLELDLFVRLRILSDEGMSELKQTFASGEPIQGETMGGVMTRVANLLSPPISGLEQALPVLAGKKIIWNDYWKDHAREGMVCESRYVVDFFKVASRALENIDLKERFPSKPGFLDVPESSAFSGSNWILGTQTFGASYQFTNEPLLTETAKAIEALGCDVIKFELSPRYFGLKGNIPTKIEAIDSLVKLARDEPVHRAVLDMPFRRFVVWATSFGCDPERWRDGLSKVEADAEYKEMFELAEFLLQTYAGTGKSFYLGHWEGDGYLRGSISLDDDDKVTPEAVQGMIDWLNIRQRAIDDARRKFRETGVSIWHYTEVNHVKVAMLGRPAVVNKVLPMTKVDLVSYSCYDTQDDPELLKGALDFIESRIPPNPVIKGRRVFIGEYGFPAVRHSAYEQVLKSQRVITAALEWGTPLILYWEMFNNEVAEDGSQIGYWMIDDKGRKTLVYEWHVDFYRWARDQVEAGEFRRDSRDFLHR